jgi:phenylacetate 2-hydroxylase
MTVQVIALAVISVVYFVIRYLNRTDVPKIKNLPEIPGVPIFGNLLQLGSHHAKVAQKWAKQYGPVFQVRMGNRVRARTCSIRRFRKLRKKLT